MIYLNQAILSNHVVVMKFQFGNFPDEAVQISSFCV